MCGCWVWGRPVQTVEQPHFFNGFAGGGGVFFPFVFFSPQQTAQGNVFYDNRFKQKRHMDRLKPLKFKLLAVSP